MKNEKENETSKIAQSMAPDLLDVGYASEAGVESLVRPTLLDIFTGNVMLRGLGIRVNQETTVASLRAPASLFF